MKIIYKDLQGWSVKFFLNKTKENETLGSVGLDEYSLKERQMISYPARVTP